MSRQHIEFIHTSDMPWSKKDFNNFLEGIKYKILSIDNDTKEISVILKFPKGWKQKSNLNLLVYEEIYILSGSININNQELNEGCYSYLPANYPRKLFISDNGAEVLSFFSGKLSYTKKINKYNKNNFIKKISLFNDGWDNNYKGINSPEIASSGSKKKLLRTDKKNGDQTWIMGIIPSYQEKKVESHPVVQECFILNGEIEGNCGTMVKGSYFWRPRDILHGPYGTKTGCTILSRSKGGKLIVDYYDLDKPFDFNSTHQVVVPENLKKFSRKKIKKIKF